MIRIPYVSRLTTVMLPALFCLLLSCMFALNNVQPTAAQAATPQNCNVLLMIDKSASMHDNWLTLRTQVENLFQSLGDIGGISLGYWTFSADLDPAATTYNEPYRGYVDTTGSANNVASAASFINPLPEDPDQILRGKTNYEQAFGYNNGVANNKADLRNLRQDAKVLVLLTDGLPNYPVDPNNGSVIDGNPYAVQKGYEARQTYGAKTVIGSYVTTGQAPDLSAMNKTINGDESNSTNIGPLQFGNIEAYLTDAIEKACDVNIPTYSLKPTAQLSAGSDSVALPGETVAFDYSVKNETTDGSAGISDWQTYNFILKPNVANILTAPVDGVTDCANIQQRFGAAGNATCITDNISSDPSCAGILDPRIGTNFPATYDQTLYSTPSGCIQVPEDLPIGSQICSVIRLKSPATGRNNRISNAACVPIGKAPLVQVHGGDVRVGRDFSGSGDENSGVYTSRFKVSSDPKETIPSGRQFGSWVEYGILAPGLVSKAASLSGYAGGYDSAISSTTCDLLVNRLTFANIITAGPNINKCGYLSESRGNIPDTATQLVATTPITTPFSSPLKFDASSAAGLYTISNSSYAIDESTIAKGKSIIVNVPDGTVTINGDIKNADETYGKISEIPQLVIIAKNIKIKENVERVDAWLIAKGDEGDGKIDTCAGYTPPFSSGVCGKLLTINGPVMARELGLWRTKVDLSETTCKVTGSQDCRYVGLPAEVINLPASSILWAKNFRSNPARVQTSNTVELPPYF